MVDVHESFPFTVLTFKLSSIEKLSLRNCKLYYKEKLDSLSQLKILKFKKTTFRPYGLNVVCLKTLKKLLDPSTSNLEFVSL
jgi:hypothetical protein